MTLLPNSIEGKAAPYLQRIENLLGQLETERGKYMAACKPIREDIADIYTEAKDKGVAKKALAGLVKYRQLERRQKAIGDGLDIADQSDYESLVAALGEFGETELGKAVLETAKAKAGTGQTTSGRRGKKAAAPGAEPPDADAVAARTAEELADALEEVTKPFAERIGTTEPTHTVMQ